MSASLRATYNFKEKVIFLILWCETNVGEERTFWSMHQAPFCVCEVGLLQNSLFDELTNKISTDINVSRNMSAHKEMGWGKDKKMAQKLWQERERKKGGNSEQQNRVRTRWRERLFSRTGSEFRLVKDGHLPRKHAQFQQICTGLVDPRGQRLSELQRRTAWWH